MGKYRGLDADPGWIRRELNDIKRQLREQRAAKSLGASTIGEGGLTVKGGGGITLEDGGTFQLKAADGTVIFEVISNANNPDPDGNPQPNLRLFRVDGTASLIMDDPAPTADGYHQFLRMWDRSGNEIFAEDATSGKGIANPWLGGTMFPSRYIDWPKSTSGTFETIWQAQLLAQNPTITLGVQHTSDESTTTGEARFQVNGTTVGTTAPIGFTVASTLAAEQVPLADLVQIRSFFTLSLQVRRTAGPGNVMAAPYLVSGSQS